MYKRGELTIMIDVLLDALIDTLKLLPYLLITFLLLELLEHKLSKKNEKILTNNKKYGPLLGGLLGAFPQCGFSTMAANLYSSGIITTGTIIAVFLSTSDEMLPIMLGEKMNPMTIFKIIGFKVLVGIFFGIIIDLVLKKISKKKNKNKKEIHDLCEKEHCDCEHDGIIISSIKHSLKIGLFILLANVFISLIIYYVGEDRLKDILLNKNIFSYFIASLVGLIPNCASSVVMTEVFISGLITKGVLISGLLTGSGLGILILFKENHNTKENVGILLSIYFIGVVVGFLLDLFI
jgi:hypothetical protein